MSHPEGSQHDQFSAQLLALLQQVTQDHAPVHRERELVDGIRTMCEAIVAARDMPKVVASVFDKGQATYCTVQITGDHPGMWVITVIPEGDDIDRCTFLSLSATEGKGPNIFAGALSIEAAHHAVTALSDHVLRSGHVTYFEPADFAQFDYPPKIIAG